MITTADTTTKTTGCEETQEPFLYTVIRNNQFVDLPWSELDSTEQCMIYENVFHPNGCW